MQSGYRGYHSTEIAIIKIMNDILVKMDNKMSTALVVIDLSSTFDLVGHNILVSQLETVFGISGLVLKWFKSYLNQRTQSISIENTCSDLKYMQQGVPQGSVLQGRD